MIFSHSSEDFESEKERNLYYKLFGGYLFNELIAGYEARLGAFCELLNNPTAKGLAAPNSTVHLDPYRTHVSFDNYLYLFSQLKTDRGEFADIVLHDSTNRTIITIEAKLHSNWSHDKDIRINQKRLEQLQQILPGVTVIPILLVTQFRWERAKQKETNEHSNFLKFHQDAECRFRVILWEQLTSLISEQKVNGYLSSQLERYKKGLTYQTQGQWFVQQPPKATNA